MDGVRPHIPLWGFIVLMTLALGMLYPAVGQNFFPVLLLILFGYKIRPVYEEWLARRQRAYQRGQLAVRRAHYFALVGAAVLVGVMFNLLGRYAAGAFAQTATPTPDVYGPVTYQQAADTIWILTRLTLLVEASFGLVIAYAFWRFVWVVCIDPIFRLLRGRQA